MSLTKATRESGGTVVLITLRYYPNARREFDVHHRKEEVGNLGVSMST